MIRYFWGDFRYFYLGITEGVFVFFVFCVEQFSEATTHPQPLTVASSTYA